MGYPLRVKNMVVCWYCGKKVRQNLLIVVDGNKKYPAHLGCHSRKGAKFRAKFEGGIGENGIPFARIIAEYASQPM